MVNALEALERLQVGNRRFIDGRRSGVALQDVVAFGPDVEVDQRPFAIIIGCSDSRVPAEIVFDQGVGDLFVVRVAGNIVAPSQVGSVEFAAEQFGTRLVVVLGHSQCGAVRATLSELQQPSEQRSPNLHAIVNRIRPAVEDLVNEATEENPEVLLRAAVRANVRASVKQLRTGSAVLEQLIDTDALHVIGAEYSIATGLVEFFDGFG